MAGEEPVLFQRQRRNLVVSCGAIVVLWAGDASFNQIAVPGLSSSISIGNWHAIYVMTLAVLTYWAWRYRVYWQVAGAGLFSSRVRTLAANRLADDVRRLHNVTELLQAHMTSSFPVPDQSRAQFDDFLKKLGAPSVECIFDHAKGTFCVRFELTIHPHQWPQGLRRGQTQVAFERDDLLPTHVIKQRMVESYILSAWHRPEFSEYVFPWLLWVIAYSCVWEKAASLG